MDPNETWKRLIEAIAMEDMDAARELAEHLTEWISNGGMPPDVSEIIFADRFIANAVCEKVLRETTEEPCFEDLVFGE